LVILIFKSNKRFELTYASEELEDWGLETSNAVVATLHGTCSRSLSISVKGGKVPDSAIF
jgi:hypothetical protein